MLTNPQFRGLSAPQRLGCLAATRKLCTAFLHPHGPFKSGSLHHWSNIACNLHRLVRAYSRPKVQYLLSGLGKPGATYHPVADLCEMCRNTPVGWVQRFLLRTLPRLIRKLDYAITGGCCISSMGRCGDYLMNEKHPLVLVRSLPIWLGY